MKYGLIIFLLALIVRIININFLDLNLISFLIEDEIMYWEWSLQGAFMPWSDISTNTLSERMPGAFIFFQTLQWLTERNLFYILVIQSIIDSFSVVIIANCAHLLNKKYAFYTGIFAALSPLLIILSSQILSDTIFLLAFVSSLYFLIKYYKSENFLIYIIISGLMLSIATYIRAATFPFIFLSLPIIFFIIKYKNEKLIKVLSILGLYLFSSIFFIIPRLHYNINENHTYSLTSQTGSHMAYWMVPGILSLSKDLDRASSVNLVNSQITKNGGLTGSAYLDSKIMMNAAIEILSKQNKFIISYAWLRASILNIVVSPVLIDKRVRNLNHSSFANSGEILPWLKGFLKNKETIKYLYILIAASIFSFITLISVTFGYYILYKTEPIIAVLSLLIIIYFCLITGPTISPKYSLPYVPIIFYLQAIFFDKLIFLFKKRQNS